MDPKVQNLQIEIDTLIAARIRGEPVEALDIATKRGRLHSLLRGDTSAESAAWMQAYVQALRRLSGAVTALEQGVTPSRERSLWLRLERVEVIRTIVSKLKGDKHD